MTGQNRLSILGLALLAGASLATGQAFGDYTYGYNNPPLIQDNEKVAKNFPDPEGLELLNPAFTLPTQPGFENSTRGPNTVEQIGMATHSLYTFL